MLMRHSQAPERDQQRHLLMATFRVMSGAFVLAVGHSELAYFTIPVLFSPRFFAHTVLYVFIEIYYGFYHIF
jgi:hypothetical protein